jgi:zinc transport system ATP-binding protein
MSNLVTFQAVSKHYNDKVIIDNVSFALDRKTITTLIGPNGAGKTTLAKLLLGIEEPNRGKIIRNTNKLTYIPQKIQLNNNLPLDVASFMQYLAGKNIEEINEVIDFADLQSLAEKQIRTLSGGQLQRVFLAAAILSKPDLIVLDEPTQGLDMQGQNDFYQLLSYIRDKHNIAIFIISHDLHTVIKNADEVLCLNHHLCCSGIPDKDQPDSNLSQIGAYTHHHDHKH